MYLFSIILPSKIVKDNDYFRLWEKKGFHITPVHFYEPIPDTASLKADLWSKQSELIGININADSQIRLLSIFSQKFKEEYESFPQIRLNNCQFSLANNYFFTVDAEILYCMIRYFKPRKVLEIGSGYSTLLSAQAILKNKEDDPNYYCELVAIEPYPNEFLKAGFPGLSNLVIKKIQDIPFSEFAKLAENDILFIDSSHVLTIGSDVQYEYLEILPRLSKGVLVHIHDIFLPAEYPKEWILKEYRFWTEQYLLQAFLTFNENYEIVWAGSYMHLKHPEMLERAFNSYKRSKKWPGSFWMRKVK
jgi:hypothetical protein